MYVRYGRYWLENNTHRRGQSCSGYRVYIIYEYVFTVDTRTLLPVQSITSSHFYFIFFVRVIPRVYHTYIRIFVWSPRKRWSLIKDCWTRPYFGVCNTHKIMIFRDPFTFFTSLKYPYGFFIIFLFSQPCEGSTAFFLFLLLKIVYNSLYIRRVYYKRKNKKFKSFVQIIR